MKCKINKNINIILMIVISIILNGRSALYASETKSLLNIKNENEEIIKIKSNIKDYLKKECKNNELTAFAGSDTQVIMPVGAVYINTKDINPSSIFGGTWTKIATGRTLVGFKSGDTNFNTIEKEAGVNEITLNTSQMPQHKHGWTWQSNQYTSSDGAHYHNFGFLNKKYLGNDNHNRSYVEHKSPSGSVWCGGTDVYTQPAGKHTHGFSSNESFTIKNTGGGQPMKLQQPYVVVNIWKRTA